MGKLEIEHISFSYDDMQVLDNVNLSLQTGIYGLLGPNGSGKTTLMKIIAEILHQDEGHVLWECHDTTEMGACYLKLLGYVPQCQAMYQTFTVEQYMLYMAMLKGVGTEAPEECDKWIKAVDMQAFQKRKIKTLSGGMRQRLLIAQAFLGNPQIILMDEPTVGLDPAQRDTIREIIKENAKDRVIVISSHIVADVDYLADEVIFLKKGRIIMKGDKEAVLQESQRRYMDGELQTMEDLYVKLYEEK